MALVAATPESEPYWPKQAMEEMRQSISALKRKIKVVVLEDSSDDTFFLKTILDQYPTETVYFGSGVEASAYLLAQDVDLAFVDIRVPKVSGSEVITAVRKVKPKLPFIITTAFADHDITQAIVNTGAIVVIPKPVRKEDIESIFSGLSDSKQNAQ